jgi:hypothetical protein
VDQAPEHVREELVERSAVPDAKLRELGVPDPLVADDPSERVLRFGESGDLPRTANAETDGVQPERQLHWAESVAPGDLEPLIGYVRQQRAHHRAHAGLEPWQLAPP